MRYASSTRFVGVRALLVGHFTLAFCAFAAGESIPFANYARFAEPGRPSFAEGPFPEYGLPVLTADPLPGWDENVVYEPFVPAPDVPPPSLDMDTMIMSLRQGEGRTTMIARDAEGNEIGRIVADQVGEGKVDLNAANATVNETDGTIRVQVDGSLLGDQPAVTVSLVEATGIYDSDVIITDISVGYSGGYFLLALDDDPSTSLQENILTAFQTNQFVGAEIVGLWTGSYVPEPSSGLMLTLGAILLAGRRSRRWC